MKRAAVVPMLLSVIVAGCGSANAFNYDANDDVHCLAIYSFAVGQAMEQQTTARQLGSANLMAEWYGPKARQGVADLRKEEQDKQVGLIFEALRHDPAASVETSKACFERAASDPAFVAFAKARGFGN